MNWNALLSLSTTFDSKFRFWEDNGGKLASFPTGIPFWRIPEESPLWSSHLLNLSTGKLPICRQIFSHLFLWAYYLLGATFSKFNNHEYVELNKHREVFVLNMETNSIHIEKWKFHRDCYDLCIGSFYKDSKKTLIVNLRRTFKGKLYKLKSLDIIHITYCRQVCKCVVEDFCKTSSPLMSNE